MPSTRQPRAEPVERRPQAARAVSPRRFPARTLLFVVLGVGLMTASVLGAGWVLNSHAGDGKADDAGAAESDYVYAFGHVDVEGGVISLYPVLPAGGASNRVVEVPAQEMENRPVKKGAVLLRLGPTLARNKVREAEADLAAAEEKVKQAEKAPAQHAKLVAAQAALIKAARARVDEAEKTFARVDRLYRTSQGRLASEEERDIAQTKIPQAQHVVTAEEERLAALEKQGEQLRHDIVRAKSDVEAKKAQREQAREALANCELEAPVDGTVLRVLVNVGDLLGPQPREPAIFFCPDTPRIIRAEVDQEFAAFVKVGQPAVVRDNDSLKGEWRGKVKRISDWFAPRRSILLEPRQVNDVRTLECIVELGPARPEGLRIGQRVRVKIDRK